MEKIKIETLKNGKFLDYLDIARDFMAKNRIDRDLSASRTIAKLPNNDIHNKEKANFLRECIDEILSICDININLYESFYWISKESNMAFAYYLFRHEAGQYKPNKYSGINEVMDINYLISYKEIQEKAIENRTDEEREFFDFVNNDEVYSYQVKSFEVMAYCIWQHALTESVIAGTIINQDLKRIKDRYDTVKNKLKNERYIDYNLINGVNLRIGITKHLQYDRFLERGVNMIFFEEMIQAFCTNDLIVYKPGTVVAVGVENIYSDICFAIIGVSTNNLKDGVNATMITIINKEDGRYVIKDVDDVRITYMDLKGNSAKQKTISYKRFPDVFKRLFPDVLVILNK